MKHGDPLRISADAFNAFVDAAEAHRQGRMSVEGAVPGGPSAAGQVVTVRNTSGADRDRFSILAISGIVIAPADNLGAFQTRPVFTAGVAAVDSSRLVILQQPIASNACGRAMVAGVSVVRISMADATHGYARPTGNDPGMLTSDGSSGPFRILYAESGTGTKWGAVQWPVGGAGSTVRYCRITGGSGASPPYLYSAREVTRTNSHDWTDAALVMTGNLYAYREAGYPGCGRIPIGRVVPFRAGSANEYLTDVVEYPPVYG